MKTHLILCKHLGENWTTPHDPYAVWKGQADLSERKSVCRSCDDDALTETNLWEVVAVELPDWMDPTEWIRDPTGWKWFLGFGGDETWPEAWYRGTRNLSTVERWVAIKLLGTKSFRSDFRRKMRDQLVWWLEQPPEERQYPTPLSPRQFDSLTKPFDVREAKRTDQSLYWQRGIKGRRLSVEEAMEVLQAA